MTLLHPLEDRTKPTALSCEPHCFENERSRDDGAECSLRLPRICCRWCRQASRTWRRRYVQVRRCRRRLHRGRGWSLGRCTRGLLRRSLDAQRRPVGDADRNEGAHGCSVLHGIPTGSDAQDVARSWDKAFDNRNLLFGGVECCPKEVRWDFLAPKHRRSS
eukprot:3001921-Rhodomonas_salina.1